MIRSYNQVFFCLIFSFCVKASFCQNALPEIQTKLASYTNNFKPEKLFIHTDKNFYTAGEITWFKIYVVDSRLHRPVVASKVAYLEILDKNNTPVLRTKIALNEKGGDGSIHLPLTLHSGFYTIRAYTNWMKNLGASHFFEKKITIVNTLKSPEAQEEVPSPSYNLQLFPEGGNLVNGLSSKIAFHVTDRSGKSVQGKGILVNAKNDTLASFAASRFGMGHFNLTPQSDNNYKAIFILNDRIIVSQPLPKIFETGYVMQLEESGSDKLKLTVKTNVRSGYPEIFLLTQTRQVIKEVQRNVVSEGTAVFFIDKNKLARGVSQLTIFNNEKQPVCERLYFIQPDHTTAEIQASKENYSTREEVSLAIKIPGDVRKNMSLSVFQLDSLQTIASENIHHYVWLTSELNGTVEQPDYYFSSPDEEVRRDSDYLMLTHGWRRFKWEAALSGNAMLKFPRELSGHIITGRVIDIRTNTTAKDIQVFLSVSGTAYKLYTGLSNSEGIVQFDIKDYYGENEMVIQTNTQRDSFYKVEILSPFYEAATPVSILPFVVPSFSPASLINYSIGMQAQQIYTPDSLRQFYMPLVSDSFPFYGKPLYTYNLDDYVRFNTMEEVLREYVREINVGVKGSGSSLRFKLFNETDRELYTDNILVMADGIPFFNTGKVFSLEPIKIKKLDIINRNYVLGHATFRGLANFSSYNGSYEGLQLDPKAITIDYEGLQFQREFYSPDYSSATQRNSRIPDFRNTLLWVPYVTTKQIQFYTGDNKGRFIAILQGIDASGQTTSATLQLNVK